MKPPVLALSNAMNPLVGIGDGLVTLDAEGLAKMDKTDRIARFRRF